MSAVWDLKISTFEKLVLLALADCANDEGECWPSIATLRRKTGAGERTIQRSIDSLQKAGLLKRTIVTGKGNRYHLYPRHSDTPATQAPPPETTQTPATVAPKPSRTIIKHTEARARVLPVDWKPVEFGSKTKSRAVVDGWPPGEADAQLEHFTAHHRSKGNRFTDWQDAWSTWVLNSRRFGKQHGHNDNRASTGRGADRRSSLARAIDEGLEHLV